MQGTIREVVGNLAFTRTGDAWAVWRLQGIPAGFGGSKDAEISRKIHQALFTALCGTEALLLGLSSTVNAAAIVQRMLDGVDLTAHPEWEAEARLTLQALKTRDDLGGREYFLAVPLKASSVKSRIKASFNSVSTQIRDLLALPVQLMSKKDADPWHAAALQLKKTIPDPFHPTDATLAEMLWIHARNITRGIPAREYPPNPLSPEVVPMSDSVNTRRVFPFAVHDEGARADKSGSPLKNRYIKITDVDTQESTYQAMLYLAAAPSQGWSDILAWFHSIDLIGMDADWCIRMTTVTAQVELQKAKRSERNLKDQANQQQASTIVAQVGGAVEVGYKTLAEYVAALKVTDDEMAVRAGIIVALSDTSPTELEDKVNYFRDQFRRSEFRWDRPIGGQEHAWSQFMPGNATNQLTREFEQTTTVRQFATLAPLVSRDLGDNKGFMLGENQSSGKDTPVFMDLYAQVSADKSPAVGVCGEPGGGKSTAMKCIIADEYRRGARIVIVDPTAAKEYGVFAGAITDPTVMNMSAPAYSLDPLRMHGPAAGYTEALWLVATLTRVKKDAEEYRLIRELFKTLTIPSFANAYKWLKLMDAARKSYAGYDTRTIRNAYYLLDEFASTPFGASLFDPDLPVLPLDARALVFLTAGLRTPFESELTNVNTYAEMPPEKLFGRAMYALIFKVCRHVCFIDKTDFALCVFDEAHTVMHEDSMVGELDEWIRDGRKHRAALILGSQDANDFGNSNLAGLMQNRIVFRQTDRKLAKRNLLWLQEGFDTDDSLVKMVTEDLSPLGSDGKVPLHRRGEAIFRDIQGHIGRIRITLPHEPRLRSAVLSTPEEKPVTIVRTETVETVGEAAA